MYRARGPEHPAAVIIGAWLGGGTLAGAAIGGAYGTAIFPIAGTIIGGFVGVIAGAVAGLVNGLLLAWIRPSARDAPLVAQATTELIVLPLQLWLWLTINPRDFLPLVIAPSVVSIGVAAYLGRRLPPALGPGGNRGWRRPPVIARTGLWWSIEVMHGRGSAFRWQEQHDSALIEAALASRVLSGAWRADQWGVVFEVRFATHKEWKAFRARPAVRRALDDVPDPAGGLFIYRGRSGSTATVPAPARDSDPAGREEALIR